jgi:hypothetical protein
MKRNSTRKWKLWGGRKSSRNVINENLNKSNKKHRAQYYQQTRSGRRRNREQVEEILHTDDHKEKIYTSDYNIQELWNTIKAPNLRIHKVLEKAEIQTKGIGNLFSES